MEISLYIIVTFIVVSIFVTSIGSRCIFQVSMTQSSNCDYSWLFCPGLAWKIFHLHMILGKNYLHSVYLAELRFHIQFCCKFKDIG